MNETDNLESDNVASDISKFEEELLEEVFRERIENLTIEFLLPNDLICVDVENWTLSDGDPIGFVHQYHNKNDCPYLRFQKCYGKTDAAGPIIFLFQTIQQQTDAKIDQY